MKIQLSMNRRGGTALIVMLALLALILVFVSANMRSLANLERETRRIEQRQIRRLESHGATNAVVPVPVTAQTVPHRIDDLKPATR
jgi:type II secretory pathway component PulK